MKMFNMYFFNNLRRIVYIFFRITNGPNRLSNNFDDIVEGKVFVDVGAYVGEWTQQAISAGARKVIAYEPIINFSSSDIFKNHKVTLLNYFISEQSVDDHFYIDGLATSTAGSGLNKLDGDLITVSGHPIAVSEENEIRNNETVIKINIEGGEYDLIKYLEHKELISEFEYIFIQTHPLQSNTKKNLRLLSNSLRKTHKLIFNYPLIWQIYERKN